MPAALLTINGFLAISSMEEGHDFDLLRHERMMSESGFGKEAIDEAKLYAVNPIRERIRTICKSAAQSTEEDPIHADEVARRILDSRSIGFDLKALDVLLGVDHSTRIALRDEVALRVLSSVLSFSRKTERWKKAKRLLNRCLDVAASSSTKSQINESIIAVKENAKSDFGWCGKGYFKLQDPLLSELERAREYAGVFDWDRAIGLLERLYENYTGDNDRRLIGKPLALCRNMRANLRLSNALSGLQYRYAPITEMQRNEIRRAVVAAEEDVSRAYELDPQNDTIRKNYYEVREIARKIGVSLPRKAQARKPATTAIPSVRAPSVPREKVKGTSGISCSRIVVIGIALLVFGSYFMSLCSGPISSSPRRVPTRTVRPTKGPINTTRPLVRPTSTSYSLVSSSTGCVSWKQVDLLDVGKEMCVTGIVRNAYSNEEAYFITFSNEPGDFYILSYEWVFPGLGYGSCVMVEGTVERLGSSPIIQIKYHDSLYKCE